MDSQLIIDESAEWQIVKPNKKSKKIEELKTKVNYSKLNSIRFHHYELEIFPKMKQKELANLIKHNFRFYMMLLIERDLYITRRFELHKFNLTINDKSYSIELIYKGELQDIFEALIKCSKIQQTLIVVNSPVKRLFNNIDFGEHHMFYSPTVLCRDSFYIKFDLEQKIPPEVACLKKYLKTKNADVFTSNNEYEPQLDENQKACLEDCLKNKTIAYRLTDNGNFSMYKFIELVKCADEMEFSYKKGKITVSDYFKLRYGIELRYPKLPLLKVKKKYYEIYWPIEFCSVIVKRSSYKKIRTSSVEERNKKIENALKEIGWSSGLLKSITGIECSEELAWIPSKIVKPPELGYRNGSVVPENGQWIPKNFLEVHNKPILWTIINVSNTKLTMPQINQFSSIFIEASLKHGFNFDFLKENNIKESCLNPTNHNLNELLDIAKQSGFKLVMMILEGKKSEKYNEIKRISDEKQIITQCMQANKIKRFDKNINQSKNFVNGLLQKINIKFNGKNHNLRENSTKFPDTIIFGADVSHPSGQKNMPSIAAISFSLDSSGAVYESYIKPQESNQEIIYGSEEMLKIAFFMFKQKNGKLPSQILYFRDGVGVSQYEKILTVEERALKNLIKSIYGAAKLPKLVLIVVQKRHHTRFLEQSENKIVPIGTVVDDDIVSPFVDIEFYLKSNNKREKPTKYTVLTNEMNASKDDLEKLTFDLCHVNGCSNFSMSVPAPIYYADLAAYRGRGHFIAGKIFKCGDIFKVSST